MIHHWWIEARVTFSSSFVFVRSRARGYRVLSQRWEDEGNACETAEADPERLGHPAELRLV